VPAASEPELLTAMKQAVRADHPIELLVLASTLLDQFDERNENPFADDAEDLVAVRDQFIDSLIGVDAATTTALMTAMAAIAGGELADRLDAAVAIRRQRLPWWLDQLTPLLVEDAAMITDVLHQSEDSLLGVRTIGGHALTVLVLVNHDLGGVVTDLVVMPDEAHVVRDRVATSSDRRDLVIEEVDPADLRAVLAEAIEWGARTWPPHETDTWPAGRPLVEWLLDAVPDGGTGRAPVEPDPDFQDRLVEEFMASPEAANLHPDDADVADWLTWFRLDYTNGNPYQWGPASVEVLLLDWLPRKVLGADDLLPRAPEVLVAHVRWGHRHEGIRAGLTDEVLAVITELTDDYLDVVSRPRPQGPAALLDAMGITPIGPDDDVWLPELAEAGIEGDHRGSIEALYGAMIRSDASIAAAWLPSMEREVGGPEALAALDDEPLPDEPLDLSGVPDDVHDRVRTIAGLVDDACEAMLHLEERTAARRFLADVARRSGTVPPTFQRRSARGRRPVGGGRGKPGLR